MQKVTILCVGKLKEKFYADAVSEYSKRLSRFCKLDIVELNEERLPEDPSPAQIEAALSREADTIRAKLPPAAMAVALCVEGKQRSSEELARLMADSASRGVSHLVFLIGGSFGLHPIWPGSCCWSRSTGLTRSTRGQNIINKHLKRTE